MRVGPSPGRGEEELEKPQKACEVSEPGGELSMAERESPSTDVTLVRRLGRNPNDAAAWDEFVRQYGRKIYQWCRYWKLQRADAEDVTQDVLVEVARQMRTFSYDPSRSFRGWLKAITHGAWCDWLEKRRRQAQGSGDSRVLALLQTAEARDDLVQKLAEQYDAELLEAAMTTVRSRVEERTWEAFRRLALEGQSGADAAEQLGMKVGAAFMARSRVQKMLQDEIRRLEEGEGQG